MLGQIPPWLDVRPEQFVHAAAMGAEAGLQVARMRQAAEEAAASRAERGREFDASQQMRQFERSMQMQMHAEEMRQRREEQQTSAQARTDYNLAMLDLRKKTEQAREDQSKDNLDFRQKTQGWHQQRYELEKEKFDAQMEREGKKLSGEDAAQVKMLEEQARQMNQAALSPNLIDPDGSKARALQQQADGVRDQVLGIYRKAAISKPSDADAPPPGWKLTSPGSKWMMPDLGQDTTTPPPTATGADSETGSPIPSPQAGAPQSPAMPSFDLPPKNPKDREKGKTYQIPNKGPFTWNGDAWESYVPPSHDEQSASDVPAPEEELAAAPDEEVPPPEEEPA